MKHQLAVSCAAVLLLAAALVAQTPSITYYGSGCNPGSPPPLIRTSGSPVIGGSIRITSIALPNGVYGSVAQDMPVLLTGITRIAVTIPPISPSQPANCTLLVDPLVYSFMPLVSSTRFQSTVNFAIPNNPALLGFKFFQQWASLYSRTSNPTSIIRTTNAQEVVVGR